MDIHWQKPHVTNYIQKCKQKNFNLDVTTNIHPTMADISESTMNAVWKVWAKMYKIYCVLMSSYS